MDSGLGLRSVSGLGMPIAPQSNVFGEAIPLVSIAGVWMATSETKADYLRRLGLPIRRIMKTL